MPGRIKIQPGTEFGLLKFIVRDCFEHDKSWFMCKCKEVVLLRTDPVKRGRTKSCGCLKNKRKRHVGQKFNQLTMLSKCEDDPMYGMFECECDGNVKRLRIDHVVSGDTKSCGCYRVEMHKTHGMSHTEEHNIWIRMKQRCINPNYNEYEYYGARGIMVCPEWIDSFEKFYEDMGPRPSLKHSIDRIDVNGNYEPSNCRWATCKQQARNKTNNFIIEYRGEKRCLTEWAEITGIHWATIKSRIKRDGWSIEDALTVPVSSRGGPNQVYNKLD